jgi:3-isopropylmalate/(R)-2-methylmalate dehydratase large subunit
MTIVCGDSHTSTHGAFGCIAFGIGTSEVEMVLATQCLLQTRPRLMRITIDGALKQQVLPKDIILHIIAQLSANGTTGYFIEFAGSVIRNMSMEARMTICNMSIEMGARGGLIAPDEVTYSYLKDKVNATAADFDAQRAIWAQLYTDEDAVFDLEVRIDAADISPMITYGTNPGMGIAINSYIPDPGDLPEEERINFDNALKYMGLQAGQKIAGTKIDYVFIGSCTNSRIEDLRVVATYVKGKRKAADVTVWIVPGSKQVEKQAIKEGLDKIFNAAGFQMRQPGCSACLAMNEDKIPAGKYCVSTSNRNFEGRQGPQSRTLLASPLTAAAAAIAGVIVEASTDIN